MQVDDRRRRQLLERGAELFATHSYAELSMATIAREAGISKALLYHYFASKQEFFVATLQQGAEEIVGVTQPDLCGAGCGRWTAWSSTGSNTGTCRAPRCGSS
jgi:AcrR family transcriptional regulator